MSYIATPLAKCWHIAVVAPRKEGVVVSDMKLHGVEAYYPKRGFWKQFSGGRKERAERPIVPGYVFFRLDHPGHEERLTGIDGLVSCLRVGRALAAIPRETEGDQSFHWVERTREQEKKGEFDTTIDRSPKANPGDIVRIVAGAFADRMAVVLKAVNKKEWRIEVVTEGNLKGVRATVGKLDVALPDVA